MYPTVMMSSRGRMVLETAESLRGRRGHAARNVTKGSSPRWSGVPSREASAPLTRSGSRGNRMARSEYRAPVLEARRAASRIRTLALAGVVGPVLFTVLVILQGLLIPAYSHVRLPIS